MAIADNEHIRIERLELGMWGTNAYVVVCQGTGESVLIDAPADADEIMGRLEGTTPRYILITHGHGDHTGALPEVRARLRVPVAAHEADSRALPCPADILLKDNDIISFGEVRFEVLHTPGHTPGSLCFRTGRRLFSGDTIFSGGPGKTDSPDAFRQIVASLREKVLVLPDDTVVYPGHGDSTVLKKEKGEFAVFSSRKHAPDLCGDVVWLTS